MRGKNASIAAAIATFVAACKSPDGSQATPTAASAPAPASSRAATTLPPASSASVAPPRASSPAASASASSSPVASASSAIAKGTSKIALDKAQDVATGSYPLLGAAGVMIRKKDGDVLVTKLGDKIAPIADDGAAFSHVHASVVDRDGGSVVYWVAERSVKRRKIDSEGKIGPIEDVAKNAEDGYAPFAAHLERENADAVAFVAKRTSKDGERPARLWIEGKGEVELSPNGSGASSVWLVVSSGAPSATKTELAAIWLDSRSALAPIHGAWIDPGASPLVAKSEGVVWIAPPSELVTSVEAIFAHDKVFALVATPRNGADFGLASAPAIPGAPPANEAIWLDYPNGLDPAPVAPATFCGEPVVVLARPTARPIDAPKVIEIASIDAAGRLAPIVEVARGGHVDHVTAWTAPKGDGWIAFALDGRTQARHVRCGGAKK